MARVAVQAILGCIVGCIIGVVASLVTEEPISWRREWRFWVTMGTIVSLYGIVDAAFP